jgi:hypothetical protein
MATNSGPEVAVDQRIAAQSQKRKKKKNPRINKGG